MASISEDNMPNFQSGANQSAFERLVTAISARFINASPATAIPSLDRG
jgi:hypothetical protein